MYLRYLADLALYGLPYLTLFCPKPCVNLASIWKKPIFDTSRTCTTIGKRPEPFQLEVDARMQHIDLEITVLRFDY